MIFARITISATSPDSRANFCNKLSPTDLNFGPFFSLVIQPLPSHAQYPCETPPLSQIMAGMCRGLDGLKVLLELEDDMHFYISGQEVAGTKM